jgi:hypothetical protein
MWNLSPIGRMRKIRDYLFGRSRRAEVARTEDGVVINMLTARRTTPSLHGRTAARQPRPLNRVQGSAMRGNAVKLTPQVPLGHIGETDVDAIDLRNFIVTDNIRTNRRIC